MKKFKVFLTCVLVLVLFCGVLGAIGIYTTRGSRLLTQQVLSKYTGSDNIEFAQVEGNLNEGMVFENLAFEGIQNLPPGALLKIQKLYVNLLSFNLKGLVVEIENARLVLPEADPIVLTGSLKNQELQLNIYSKGFTVNQILSYLPDFKKLVPLKGDINDIDLFISGDMFNPHVKGQFVADQFIYKAFVLSEAPIVLDLQLKDVVKEVQIYGPVQAEEGNLQTKRVIVNLDKSLIHFNGPWNNPRLNLKARAKVEKTKIQIGLRGTVNAPELVLSSEPSYSRQKLMIMLATGKSWQSVEDSLESGLNSAALTKDFIDYFLFGGKSNLFAKKFGISEFSVKYNESQQGISAKKMITDKLEVGYGVEQNKVGGKVTDVSQKIGGELQVTDKVSVGVEREVMKTQQNGLSEEKISENNDKFLLKYKKSF